MSISLATAASGLATLLLCWVVGTVAVRIFFQPLSSIPGPKRALLDWSWYPLIARDGHARSLALTLHKKYGHAVRVSTNEVWFDSEDAFKIIYS